MRFFGLLLITLLLLGCAESNSKLPAKKSMISSEATTTSHKLAGSVSLPAYIRWLAPAPYESISIESFTTELLPRDTYDLPPPLPISMTGFRSQLCMHLDAKPLLKAGDRLLDLADVADRVVLYINGEQRELRLPQYAWDIFYNPTIEWFDVSPQDDAWTINNLRYREVRSDVAVYNELGFMLCWDSPTDLGTHKAEFQYSLGDTILERFSWSFELHDEPTTLRADLSDAQVQQEELPSYLNWVSPEPGAYLTPAWFESNFAEDMLFIEQPAPQAMVGQRSSICIHIFMHDLAGPGDVLALDDDVLERLFLEVNDRQLNVIDTPYFVYTDIGPFTLRFDNEPNQANSHVDADSTDVAIIAWDGNYFCWGATAVAGVNTAKLTFVRGTGQQEIFSWQFYMIEE